MSNAGSPHEQFVEVSVSTTAGFYPNEGFERASVHQKLEVMLKHAQKELVIKDVAGWVATVTTPSGKRQLDPDRSYVDNSLSGKVEIDWGPSEGGGG